MAIRVECECGRAFRVRDEVAGRRVKCPGCGKAVLAAEADAEEVLESAPSRRRDDEDDEVFDEPRSRKKRGRRRRQADDGPGVGAVLKMGCGAMMLGLAGILLLWIGYNLLVAPQKEFTLSLGGIFFVTALSAVGYKWVRGE